MRLIPVMFMLAAIPLAARADDVALSPYLSRDGQPADTSLVQMTEGDDGIALTFTAPADGVYQVGLAIEAPAVTLLSPDQRECARDTLAEPLVLRCPYDWTVATTKNVMGWATRLVMPGAIAGDHLFLADTHELYSVRVEATADGVRALLLAHRFVNEGWDTATADLQLAAGEEVSLDVLTFASIADANRERYGESPNLEATMVQSAYRGWTANFMSNDGYREIAGRLAGIFDWLIVRETETRPEVPPILHERGMKAIAYQYLGALRRYSVQVAETDEATLGMRGSGGEVFTAPRSPDGAWLLLDIRQQEMRDLCVRRAVEAIDAGFDGLFLDGTSLFADAAGHRGGNVPDAEHSMAWAHWKLLSEITEAVHAANPEAIVGCLGNNWYDAINAADFGLKERMYFSWDNFARKFGERVIAVRGDMDLHWEDGQAPYAAKGLAYGVKGVTPIGVQTAWHLIRRPMGLRYTDTGDMLPEDVPAWLDVVTTITTGDLYLTEIEPEECTLHFAGADTLWADEDCRVTSSRLACLLSEAGACIVHQATAFELSAETRYRLVEDCADGDEGNE